MVRFIRGLGLGIIGFFLFLFAGMVVIANTIGLSGEEEFDMATAFQEVPIWMILMIIGILLMILAPIYYWFLEPILKKRRETQTY